MMIPIADSISHLPQIKAIHAAIERRITEFDLSDLLVYIVNTAPASYLPLLAENFNVLGYNGFLLAQTDNEKRELIKNALLLQRYKGTPWAIKEALRSLGYGDCIITENVTHWATFRITLNLQGKTLGLDEIQNIIETVNAYKNIRSHLLDVSYTVDIGESEISLIDVLNAAEGINDREVFTIGGNTLHNGLIRRNGTSNYSRDSDKLTINIITDD
ncbi:phage tail P2-like protein [Chitinophaga skermanii]|uniref:Phage tail P2-like protein n=1 Tax=Chitinophaga skermanii TaxID=331697 RepID=A0A327Q855_9BACT|nr:phage tail protein I [Chitinophaga skermanii]RAJ00481.1 phage tail P2-like protein [Chitinophaga skermanii]